MNFGLATFRELIEDFLTNTGGRRGRQREERRQESDEFDGAAGDESSGESGTDTAQSATDAEADTDEEPAENDDSDGSSGGGFFGGGSSGDEDLDDLYYRLGELEDELEDKENELGTVQDSQQHVAEQVEEMNERVQQLLGVYDQVTDDVNPFTGEGEERNGFGVFGEDEAGQEADDRFGIQAAAAESAADDETDETVSFDDLKGMIEDAASAQADGGQTISFDEEEAIDEVDDENDTHVEVQATESVDGPDSDSETTDDETRSTDDADEPADDPDDVALTTLADTYATDIIVFEWLTQLVRTGGSAATLRAISYYAEIGWIGDDVKQHLEGVLSGPDLDMHVDPGSTPEELTAEDHADSYTYIMKLEEIHETQREVEPQGPAESRPGP